MTFNIAIIDYGMGNLKSIYKCLIHLDIDAIITDKIKLILDSDGIILPGVGAFRDAMKNLKRKKLIRIIRQVVEEEKPFFGICLGLQLLHTKSYEMGETEGLDIIKGKVLAFNKSLVDKVPQIGWNNVRFEELDHYLVQGIPNNSFFYFVHSFYSNPDKKDYILGTTKYGEIEFCSIICKDNLIATQFHPEKSSKYGIQMFKNFIDFCKK